MQSDSHIMNEFCLFKGTDTLLRGTMHVSDNSWAAGKMTYIRHKPANLKPLTTVNI